MFRKQERMMPIKGRRTQRERGKRARERERYELDLVIIFTLFSGSAVCDA